MHCDTANNNMTMAVLGGGSRAGEPVPSGCTLAA
jgi:hypothetical protein